MSGRGVPVDPAGLRLRGGPGGLAAQWASLGETASAYDDLGDLLRRYTALPASAMGDGAVLASAALAPVTFARVEASLGLLVAGPSGLPVRALRAEATAEAIRAARSLVQEAEHRASLLHDGLLRRVTFGLGFGAGWSVALPARLVERLGGPRLPSPPLPGGVGPVGGSGPPAVGTGEQERRRLGDRRGLEGLLGPAGGALDGLRAGLGGDDGLAPWLSDGSTRSPADLAEHYAGLYRDGDSVVRRRTDLEPDAAPASAARDLEALVHQLDGVASRSREAPGLIEVQRHEGPGGRRHVVLLPGTDDMTTLPWTQDTTARDMGTNLRSMSGQPNVYLAGVEQALRASGVREGEPVLVVGHSGGGMVAAQLAATSGLDVRQVVTLGSPTAQVPELPPHVRMTSLESTADVVPLLDGALSPDRVEHLNVRFDGGGADPVAAHRIERYAAGAAALERSDDPGVRAHLAGLRADGFLDPRAVVTRELHQVERSAAPPP